MDCGWQNPGAATNSCLECPRLLASKRNCIGLAALPQTSGMREIPYRLAMMISVQPASAPDYRL